MSGRPQPVLAVDDELALRPFEHRQTPTDAPVWRWRGSDGYSLQMDDTVISDAATDTAAADEVELVDDELLVEEISIDGMCGVY